MSAYARLQRRTIAIFGATAAIFLFLVLVGRETDRLTAALGFLGFGGAAVALFVGNRPGPVRVPDLAGRVRLPDGTDSPALVLPIAARGQWAWIAIFGLMALVAVAVALNPSMTGRWSAIAPWVAGAIAAVLGIPVVNAIRRRGDGEPMLALVPAGLLLRGLGSGAFVPWDAITAVSIRTVRDVPMLALDVTFPAAIRREGTMQILGRWERPLTDRDLSVGLALLPLPPDTALRLVQHYANYPSDRPGLGGGNEPMLDSTL